MSVVAERANKILEYMRRGNKHEWHTAHLLAAMLNLKPRHVYPALQYLHGWQLIETAKWKRGVWCLSRLGRDGEPKFSAGELTSCVDQPEERKDECSPDSCGGNTCESCGTTEDLECGPCPYASDVNGDYTPVLKCRTCRREAADDV